MKKIFSLLLVAALTAMAGMDLAAQEPARSAAYTLRSVSYRTEGRTREYYLARSADFSLGMTFPDREALDAYIADRRQLIMNERVIESVEIEASEGEALPDGSVPVDLVVKTKDTLNVIALPYFKFDSNTGFLLSARVRDYNFFGTMEPLRVNFNYEQDLVGAVTFGADADFSMPFPAFGLDWEWGLAADLALPVDAPVDSSLGISLALYLPVIYGELVFSLSETAFVGDRASDGDPYDDTFYSSTSATAAWKLPLAASAWLDDITLSPRLTLSRLWDFDGIEDERLSPDLFLTPGLELAFGRVDWVGNFRSGLETSLAAGWGFNLLGGEPDSSLGGSIAAYLAIGCIGPSARLFGLWNPDGDVVDGPGVELRGILNRRAATDAALVLNADLPLRLYRFMPSSWFGLPWMRYLDFEQHWSLFCDAALGHYDGAWFDPRDGWYAAGVEVITFPLAMRSIFLRISMGWDVEDLVATRDIFGTSPRDGRDIYEFFIGLGHHY